METIIKASPDELDIQLLKKIKEFIGDKQNIDVTISIKEIDTDYLENLDKSIQQAEEGNLISLSMKEFMAYQPSKKS